MATIGKGQLHLTIGKAVTITDSILQSCRFQTRIKKNFAQRLALQLVATLLEKGFSRSISKANLQRLIYNQYADGEIAHQILC